MMIGIEGKTFLKFSLSINYTSNLSIALFFFSDVDIPECVDSASVTMCRLIVRAGLCGYTDYSKQCCYSCDQSKLRG